MKKWKFEKEITESTKTLLTAYLATMHSVAITAIYTYNNDVYAYDLTESDTNELATVTAEKIQINSLGKKRIEKILNKSEKFATVEQLEKIREYFPKYNNGYISEFAYRIIKNGESIEEIKHSNNSKGFDIASDTKDNKQIKNLDSKATFTTYEYLIKACNRKGYKDIEKVINAIATLKEIYK